MPTRTNATPHPPTNPDNSTILTPPQLYVLHDDRPRDGRERPDTDPGRTLPRSPIQAHLQGVTEIQIMIHA